MQEHTNLVSFAHGQESGPWGHKIQHLAEIAQSRGWRVDSPDYSHTHDPDARVRQLLAQAPAARRLVLCGSSMGGYVAAHSCRRLGTNGLCLLAPALYLPGYTAEPDVGETDTVVIHGWRDDIVLPDSAIRFARAHHSRLHMVDDGHRLMESLDFVGAVFDALLARVESE